MVLTFFRLGPRAPSPATVSQLIHEVCLCFGFCRFRVGDNLAKKTRQTRVRAFHSRHVLEDRERDPTKSEGALGAFTLSSIRVSEYRRLLPARPGGNRIRIELDRRIEPNWKRIERRTKKHRYGLVHSWNAFGKQKPQAGALSGPPKKYYLTFAQAQPLRSPAPPLWFLCIIIIMNFFWLVIREQSSNSWLNIFMYLSHVVFIAAHPPPSLCEFCGAYKAGKFSFWQWPKTKTTTDPKNTQKNKREE